MVYCKDRLSVQMLDLNSFSLVYYETEFGSLHHYPSSHKNSLGARNVILIQYINPIISLPRSEIL